MARKNSAPSADRQVPGTQGPLANLREKHGVTTQFAQNRSRGIAEASVNQRCVHLSRPA